MTRRRVIAVAELLNDMKKRKECIIGLLKIASTTAPKNLRHLKEQRNQEWPL